VPVRVFLYSLIVTLALGANYSGDFNTYQNVKILGFVDSYISLVSQAHAQEAKPEKEHAPVKPETIGVIDGKAKADLEKVISSDIVKEEEEPDMVPTKCGVPIPKIRY
jgi:hypothetical protein